MRVAMVASKYPFGGAEQAAMQLAEGLEARHEVHFITSGEEAASFDEGGHRRVILPLPKRARPWHHYWNRSLVAGLRRELARIVPDVVHFHNISSRTFSVQALSVSKDYPAVWSLHDLWSRCVWSVPRPPRCGGAGRCLVCLAGPGLSVVNRLLKERAYRRSEFHVIVPCEWLKRRLAGSALASKPVHVIANAVPVERFEAGSRVRGRVSLGIPESARVVVFAGQMVNDWKGHADLLRVAARMQPGRGDLWFVFAGRVREVPAPRERVIFTGSVAPETMPDVYAAGDVFAYPSHADVMAQVVLEAMASGLPVVLNAVGGLAEMVAEGETGFVVAEGDERAFEERLRTLLDDTARARTMGAAGRARAEERFTLALQVERTERVYREAIAGRAGKGV